MITCKLCGSEIGEGQLPGLAFCNDDCAFTYAMNIPLDASFSGSKITHQLTVAEGVSLLVKSQRPRRES